MSQRGLHAVQELSEAIHKPIQKYDLPFQDTRTRFVQVRPIRTVDFRKFLFMARLGSHPIENMLLRTSPGEQSPSKAQAEITFPPDCLV